MGDLLAAAVQAEETAAGAGFRLPRPGPRQPPARTPPIPSGQSRRGPVWKLIIIPGALETCPVGSCIRHWPSSLQDLGQERSQPREMCASLLHPSSGQALPGP
ncbi:putative Tubulin Polyglutamylase Ttll2 [Manis pentadactyla]|nr:putative Tubulin Polyglutamylase Ttll2 [Manis pentadactyla]